MKATDIEEGDKVRIDKYMSPLDGKTGMVDFVRGQTCHVKVGDEMYFLDESFLMKVEE